jgi:hypothetical protein
MTLMKTLVAIALVLAALPAAGSSSFHDAVQPVLPAHPSMYSFADLYRLTVGGVPGRGWPLPDAPIADARMHVAATPAAPAPEAQFSVVRMPQPRGWVLLLAGLALAGWVARRRLGYSF